MRSILFAYFMFLQIVFTIEEWIYKTIAFEDVDQFHKALFDNCQVEMPGVITKMNFKETDDEVLLVDAYVIFYTFFTMSDGCEFYVTFLVPVFKMMSESEPRLSKLKVDSDCLNYCIETYDFLSSFRRVIANMGKLTMMWTHALCSSGFAPMFVKQPRLNEIKAIQNYKLSYYKDGDWKPPGDAKKFIDKELPEWNDELNPLIYEFSGKEQKYVDKCKENYNNFLRLRNKFKKAAEKKRKEEDGNTQREDRNTQREDRNTQREDRNTQREDRNTQREDGNTQKEDRNTQREDEKTPRGDGNTPRGDGNTQKEAQKSKKKLEKDDKQGTDTLTIVLSVIGSVVFIVVIIVVCIVWRRRKSNEETSQNVSDQVRSTAASLISGETDV